jgi:drug/metabolite transporter (DMT)-like permease
VLAPATLLGFAAMIALTVAANLMLKLGAGVTEAQRILFGILGWKSMAGLALFGCGGVVYAFLLRQVPLNVAVSFTAAQFVGVVIAASLVLGEPISPARWLGIACISLGVFVVGLTAQA